mgnify:CR=1 FL=1
MRRFVGWRRLTRSTEARGKALLVVALSLCAHLLVMAFAYATRLPYSDYMRSTPGQGDGPVISLNIFGDSTDADAVAEVAEAWSQNRPGLTLGFHSVNSWSTDPAVARNLFATGGKFGVVYHADVPFQKTLADKWLDGVGMQ